jgi:uncharacterized protein (TIGR02284 family)
MQSSLTSYPSEVAELQAVLTRYVDCHAGYVQAAKVVKWPSLAKVFLEIAQRRESVIKRLTRWIEGHGGEADLAGSPEAALHRWGMRVRAQLSSEEFHSTLTECLRGEQELARTLKETMTHHDLEPNQLAILPDVEAELNSAIRTLESTLSP